MNSIRAINIIEGTDGEDHSAELHREAWQYLLDTGIVWSLQGNYARKAYEFIQAGWLIY